MHPIEVDPIWIMGALFTAVGVIGGWYIVRLDTLVEHLRDEIIRHEKEIGSLQNADKTCTRDQDILKHDMSHIRATLLKMVAHRFMRKQMRKDWKLDQKIWSKDDYTRLLQHGDMEHHDDSH